MNRQTKFSWDDDAQKQEFRAYAADRGMTLSTFAKWACFTVRNKNKKGAHHPEKGRGARVRPRQGAISGVLDEES